MSFTYLQRLGSLLGPNLIPSVSCLELWVTPLSPITLPSASICFLLTKSIILGWESSVSRFSHYLASPGFGLGLGLVVCSFLERCFYGISLRSSVPGGRTQSYFNQCWGRQATFLHTSSLKFCLFLEGATPGITQGLFLALISKTVVGQL